VLWAAIAGQYSESYSLQEASDRFSPPYLLVALDPVERGDSFGDIKSNEYTLRFTAAAQRYSGTDLGRGDGRVSVDTIAGRLTALFDKQTMTGTFGVIATVQQLDVRREAVGELVTIDVPFTLYEGPA